MTRDAVEEFNATSDAETWVPPDLHVRVKPPTFPLDSIRAAVANCGDGWDWDARHIGTRRAHLRDADVVKRCAAMRYVANQIDRGTVWDPRIWIGVPLTERQA